ncbi:MAG: hypothetical protein ACXWE7_10610 [Nitrososphaeraceae archaeon]
MSELIILSDLENSKELSVVLSEKKFADLILNFLGKKEKLKYALKGTSFLMRLNDVEQFYYLLDAKISKEQHVYIDHFLVDISYNDGTSREISGIEALNSFHETRDVIPTNITMSWNIVIKFPNSETIENQKIELTFAKNFDKDDDLIFLVIHHTNQAWGIEVLNLVKDKISELTIKQSKRYKTVKFLEGLFETNIILNVIIISIMFFMLNILIADLTNQADGKYYYNSIQSVVKAHDSIEKEIATFALGHIKGEYLRTIANEIIKDTELRKAIIEMVDARDNELSKHLRKTIIIVLSIPVALGIFYVYLKKAHSFYKQKSFILINRRTDSEYSQFINGKSKSEFYTITAVFVSAMCGVIGNFIYQCLIDLF